MRQGGEFVVERIRERYEVLGVAGAGGQGQVLRARDAQHDRTVALKVRALDSGEDRETILSEARILLGLQPHASLPLVREDFFDADRYVMVVDWIDGQSLQDRMDAGPLGVDEAIEVLRPVGAALDHLHAHPVPIVHGDVKPANVIRATDGRIVLVDFGIASAAGASRAAGGTAGYAAPEILSGARPAPAADVFGLAATFFALISGQPPGPGARPGWLDLPRERAKRIDVTMRRALSVDPSRRPVGAAAFVEALATEPDVPNNLPFLPSSFIGREREIEGVKATLAGARLVTLAGPGGIGKTRLALQVAGEVLDEQPDGCWLVDLAPVTDPALVPGAVAIALGLPEEPGRPIAETLADHLRARQAVLVLDNCEHLVGACAALADALLRAAPRLRILATTRELLNVAGEAVFRVPAMTEAEDLFLQRARTAAPSFVASPAIAEICRRLDGIPLAIELAAARAKMLTAEQIAARLDDAFRLLTGGARTAMPRQQTLRALVDWSYHLLDDDEKRLFARLGVFSGGWTLDAAEEVCGDNCMVLDAMAQLVDKSLVVAEETEDGMRYRMLETLRTYAREKLAASPEAEVLAQRHIAWLRDFVADAAPMLQGDAQAQTLDRLERELPNARRALDGMIARGDATSASGVVIALAPFFNIRGHLTEGRRWAERVVALPEATTLPSLARLRKTAGALAQSVGDFDAALEHYDVAQDRARAEGDDTTVADVLDNAAIVSFYRDDVGGARALAEEALEIRRRSGDPRLLAESLGKLGVYLHHAGDLDGARGALSEALQAFRTLGDRTRIADALVNLGTFEHETGDLEGALAKYGEAQAIREALGDRWGVANARYNIATLELERGDAAEAQRTLAGMQDVYAELGDRHALAMTLELLGRATTAAGDLDAGRALLWDAIRAWRDMRNAPFVAEALEGLAATYPGDDDRARRARDLAANLGSDEPDWPALDHPF